MQQQGLLGLDFTHCQRWNKRRDSYRPAGELFDPRHAHVEVIETALAKSFVCEHHYSGSFPAARLNVGLLIKEPFRKEALAGVATFSVPMSQAAIPAVLDGLPPALGVELGRFVLLDHVAANAETWTLSRAFKLLRRTLPEVRGCISYCDPCPRQAADGRTVFKGHIGTIYKAFSGTYRGRSKARKLFLMPDGTVANERGLSKLRNGEVGADYVERLLREKGAASRYLGETGRDYLLRLSEGGFFRRLAHPGNHTFSWSF